MKEDDGKITKDNVFELNYGHNYQERPYNSSKCAFEVAQNMGRWTEFHQCSRKPGFGTDGLFCKQHSKKDDSLALKAFRIKGLGLYTSYNKNDYSIDEVKVEKFSDKFVFLLEENNSRKEARSNEYYIYFESEEDAVSYLKKRADANIKTSKESIRLAGEFLNSLK